jgi:hypothetical protein
MQTSLSTSMVDLSGAQAMEMTPRDHSIDTAQKQSISRRVLSVLDWAIMRDLTERDQSFYGG